MDLYIPSPLRLILGSADKTAKRYDRLEGSQETLEHPDFVKDVTVHGRFVYTACSDENVRQWSLEVRACMAILTEDNESYSNI